VNSENLLDEIRTQNFVVIELLARLNWSPEELSSVVTKNKRDPAAYLRAYNDLDGKTTGKDIGKAIGVSQQAAAVVLKGWLELGIVINMGSETNPRYRRVMRLSEKPAKASRTTPKGKPKR
jgi:hypothetical protein